MKGKGVTTRSSSLDPRDDAPDLTTLALSRGWFERGGKRISKKAGRAAFRRLLGKKQVNMMLDKAVIEYFKVKAGGRGYQTLINEALRQAMGREALEKVLRRIVREEIRSRRKAA